MTAMRGQKLTVRLNDEEQEYLQGLARSEGRSLAQYARIRLLAGFEHKRLEMGFVTEELVGDAMIGCVVESPIEVVETQITAKGVERLMDGLREADETEPLAKPSPPKKKPVKGKMCQRCSRAGRPSCEACRKAAAKSAEDVFDVEELEEK